MARKSDRRRLTKLSDTVWCDRNGCIHEDTLDPWEYGAPDDGDEDARCEKQDHRPVYIMARPSEGEH